MTSQAQCLVEGIGLLNFVCYECGLLVMLLSTCLMHGSNIIPSFPGQAFAGLEWV